MILRWVGGSILWDALSIYGSICLLSETMQQRLEEEVSALGSEEM